MQEFMQKFYSQLRQPDGILFLDFSNTVKEYGFKLWKFFVNVIKRPDTWDSDAEIKSLGLLALLNDFETIFLSKWFTTLICYSDVLYNFLQEKDFHILYSSNKVRDAST